MKKTQTAKPAIVPSPVAIVTPPSVRLTRSAAPRKGSAIVYQIPGVRGTVKIARSLFEGEPPAVLDVSGSPFAMPKPVLSKEERAALRATLTPADKARLARERANRAMARAAYAAPD